jgi:hypothetical protein
MSQAKVKYTLEEMRDAFSRYHSDVQLELYRKQINLILDYHSHPRVVVNPANADGITHVLSPEVEKAITFWENKIKEYSVLTYPELFQCEPGYGEPIPTAQVTDRPLTEQEVEKIINFHKDLADYNSYDDPEILERIRNSMKEE